jgi:C4-dicarboxylate-specific signal transduction histidine kinase
LAHEVKQPIRAAVTNAEACSRFLDRDQPDVPEARETTLEMVPVSRRAADIIDRVCSRYRKGLPRLEVVDLNEVIREMIVVLRDEARQYSAMMRTDLAEGLPEVMADRIHLQQGLMNLMLNGVEAMPDTNGELTVKSQLAEDGQVLISVIDTGVGLSTGDADHIFDVL